MGNYQPLNAAEKRAAERRCALDDYLCLVDLGDQRSAMLLDVSETGIGVQSVEGVGEGFTTSFRFQLPDTAVLVEGEGEIAWADRAGRMGVRFTRLAPELKPELRTWVASEANPLFAHQPVTEEMADLDARDRVAQLEARIIVSGWAQLQALNFLVDQISAMTQASGVAIAVEDGTGIVCKASAGIAPEVGVRVNPRSGLSWECVRTKEVVNCVDTENDPRVDRLVCRQLNMRAAMLVPVMKDGGVAGLVEVFSSRAHAFSNQTVILLRRVAEAVASLDETAGGVGQEPPLQPESRVAPGPIAAEPIEAPKAPPASSAPAVVARSLEPPPPIRQVAPPVPQPVATAVQTMPVRPPASPVTPEAPPLAAAPAIAKVPVAAAPPQAKVDTPAKIEAPVNVVKPPAPIIASAPAPAPAPATRPVAAAASAVATKVGSPFAQEIAANAKFQVAPAKPVEVATTKPADLVPVATVAATSAAKPPAPPQPIEAAKPQPAPAQVVVKDPERVKPVVERIEIPLPPPAPKEKPAEKPAPVAAKPAAVEKPLDVAPVTSIAYQDAPLPEVAFSGAAAAAKRAAEAEAATRAAKDAFEEFAYQPAAESKWRKLYIGIAAAVFFALSAVGGWYVARGTPKATNTAAPVTSAPTPNAAPPVVLPAAAITATSVPSRPTSNNVGNSSAPSGTSPNPTPPPAPLASKPKPQQPASAPALVVPRAETVAEPAPAPPVAIAPPNTAGMASLLAGPVAAPKLGRPNVSQGVTGGKQLVHDQPIYPSGARAMHLSGTVVIKIHVGKNGMVTRAEVVRGHPLLNAAALEAVKRWKYQPFMLNGEAIENDVDVQVRFDMPR